MRALRCVRASGTLPATATMPSTSSSAGEARASRMATASSWPGSVSMMIERGMTARSDAAAREQGICSPPPIWEVSRRADSARVALAAGWLAVRKKHVEDRVGHGHEGIPQLWEQTMARAINNAGLDLIKSSEGLRLESYQDVAGIWTVGYGHIKNVTSGMTITEAQATAFLRQDVADAEQTVDSSCA